MGVKLRPKPPRWYANGWKIPPPYFLDAWCERCAMPLVANEFHPVEACIERETNCDAEAALRKVAEIVRSQV